MKRIILALTLCLFAAPALAVCPSTLQLKDNAGVTPNAKFSDDGSGNCLPNVVLFSGTTAVTQGTAANLNATVVGTGTFAAQLTGATNNINNIAGTISLPTGAATSANQATEIGSLATIATNTGAAIPAQANHTTNIGAVDSISQYPGTAVPYTASATGTTTATTATLAGAASVTTYICGFSIRANATAAATGNATVTGTITGTLNYTQWTAPLASGLGVVEQIFTPCVPASATNTSIAVVSAAPGAGGVVSVTAWGYKL
jgi:hypothetical protein